MCINGCLHPAVLVPGQVPLFPVQVEAVQQFRRLFQFRRPLGQQGIPCPGRPHAAREAGGLSLFRLPPLRGLQKEHDPPQRQGPCLLRLPDRPDPRLPPPGRRRAPAEAALRTFAAARSPLPASLSSGGTGPGSGPPFSSPGSAVYVHQDGSIELAFSFADPRRRAWDGVEHVPADSGGTE